MRWHTKYGAKASPLLTIAGGGRESLVSFQVFTCLKKSSGVDLGASALSGVRGLKYALGEINPTPANPRLLCRILEQLIKNMLPKDAKDTVPEDYSVAPGRQDEELRQHCPRLTISSPYQ